MFNLKPHSNRLAPMMHHALKTDFSEYKVELTQLEIIDIISLDEIKPKMEKLLLDYLQNLKSN